MDVVYARTAADDEAGTACQGQVREALGLVGDPKGAAVYADARSSGLRRLLADARRGGLRRPRGRPPKRSTSSTAW